VFGSLPTHAEPSQSQADRLDTYLMARQARFLTDLGGQFQGPGTRFFVKGAWTLMQQCPQHLTLLVIELGMNGFWSR
jgi:hypothetical protein